MTGRSDHLWETDTDGTIIHVPALVAWGPGVLCPVRVSIPADKAVRDRTGPVRRVVLDLPAEVDAMPVRLNPGAARWLGNRLIEAAVLAEQDAGRVEYAVVTSDADQ